MFQMVVSKVLILKQVLVKMMIGVIMLNGYSLDDGCYPPVPAD